MKLSSLILFSFNCNHFLSPRFTFTQGISPIVKIAIAISIVIKKKIGDLDRDMTIADLIADLLTSTFGLIFFSILPYMY